LIGDGVGFLKLYEPFLQFECICVWHDVETMNFNGWLHVLLGCWTRVVTSYIYVLSKFSSCSLTNVRKCFAFALLIR